MPDEIGAGSAIRPTNARANEPECAQRAAGEVARWHLALDLHADALRVTDPIPMFLAQLEAIPDLADHRSPIYTILSELYSNALDYGVLGLSGMTKLDAAGFERYVNSREARFAEIGHSWVRIAVTLARHAMGGNAKIEVQGSGPGFGWRKLAPIDNGDPSA